MGSKSSQKAFPQVVKLDDAFKIAESWVNKMSVSAMEEPNEHEFEARPPRLGLGAKVRRNVEVPDSTDPVERHLIKKLGVGKRAALASQEKSNHSKEKSSDEDDDEPQSRASAFSKKRPYPPVPHFQLKKKRK
ncbi:hypothetical protein ZOSMA_26G00240 [Zostera marina]|uniref:Uncharacterized protein n=1 Tax=Zostera marina TaxID=29655 RepID=A0A0K9PE98_ZOSMR|nr:hypothetical protein ZOSMA_26G00240 [Zostera marina]